MSSEDNSTPKDQKLILDFTEVGMNDVPLVGGKNASLGEMIRELSSKGISVPGGFSTSAHAYREFIKDGELEQKLHEILDDLDINDNYALSEAGARARHVIMVTPFSEEFTRSILTAYQGMCDRLNNSELDVAVRSSATAEDLPDASFAGQQETYLNVHGSDGVVEACHRCFASLFTNRAISYRVIKGFDHFSVALSFGYVGVQQMVRSDMASAGVAFSIDTESGFKNAVLITGSYGLGENVVQVLRNGFVNPDEFLVFKPNLFRKTPPATKTVDTQQSDKEEVDFDGGTKTTRKITTIVTTITTTESEGGDQPCYVPSKYSPILAKRLGSKEVMMIYQSGGKLTKNVNVSPVDQKLFCLKDEEVIQLARWVTIIEDHYTTIRGQWTPMDVEWAKDGKTGQLFIVQARPETVQSQRKTNLLVSYHLSEESSTDKSERVELCKGRAVGSMVGQGKASVIRQIHGIANFKKGAVLVTSRTDPDWEPIMKLASAIVTDQGGRTCHAAIIARELGIPAIVGCNDATAKIQDGKEITVSCADGEEGIVYDGIVPFTRDEVVLDTLPPTKTTMLINVSNPEEAFSLSFLPTMGVGLARLEFIIANHIRAHPLALLHPDRVEDEKVREELETLTESYPEGEKDQFFVDKLASGVSMIAAAFHPNPVIVRLSDFKSNEYANLLGGKFFEPNEENPMIGWRGASRYYDVKYREAFALECQALKKIRDVMGLRNIIPMVPFCRSPEEAKRVLEEMKKNGLERGVDDLQVYMMCEIPANVVLADQFCDFFDGFSIGSNDLTQLTLGLDRDSQLVAHLFDERNEAVKAMVRMVIETCIKRGRKIGICGQGPSDYPEFAAFLVRTGINSLSLNPDSLLKTKLLIAKIEEEMDK